MNSVHVSCAWRGYAWSWKPAWRTSRMPGTAGRQAETRGSVANASIGRIVQDRQRPTALPSGDGVAASADGLRVRERRHAGPEQRPAVGVGRDVRVPADDPPRARDGDRARGDGGRSRGRRRRARRGGAGGGGGGGGRGGPGPGVGGGGGFGGGGGHGRGGRADRG